VRNFLFVGDTHGDLKFMELAAAIAAEHDAQMVQVGDWGFLWPDFNQLAALSTTLIKAGEDVAKPPVRLMFCCGNHDDHPNLRKRLAGSTFATELAPNVVYQPRGSTYEDDEGTRLLFVGGAPSIDWQDRMPGRSWWKDEEVISESEFAVAMKVEGPIHVLITHDAPDYPPGFTPKGDSWFCERATRSMDMVRRLCDHHRPVLHVHGHWHHRYSIVRGTTKIVGLHCNYGRLGEAVMLWNRNP
jgi:Calcineurin-like phosphoesterase